MREQTGVAIEDLVINTRHPYLRPRGSVRQNFKMRAEETRRDSTREERKEETKGRRRVKERRGVRGKSTGVKGLQLTWDDWSMRKFLSGGIPTAL